MGLKKEAPPCYDTLAGTLYHVYKNSRVTVLATSNSRQFQLHEERGVCSWAALI